MQDRLTDQTLVIATGHSLSLAVLAQGAVLAETAMEMDKGHAEALVPEIARLLAPFGGAAFRCARIVVEVGPGSFTGLRVGVAAAKALGLAWNVPVCGVRSTQLVAAEARLQGRGEPLFVALSAPRGQIWIERFGPDGLLSLGLPQAVCEADIPGLLHPGAIIVGSAARLFGSNAGADAPRAAALLGLAGDQLMQAKPLYVRAGDRDVSHETR